MNKEIQERAKKIQARVIDKKMKPLEGDVYVLLTYINMLEDSIENIRDKADTLAQRSHDINEMFNPNDLVRKVQQDLDLLSMTHGSPIGPIGGINPEVRKFLRRFVSENRDTILDESEKTRERIIENFGEHSLELSIFDSVIQQIENLDEDDDDENEGGHYGQS